MRPGGRARVGALLLLPLRLGQHLEDRGFGGRGSQAVTIEAKILTTIDFP